MVLMSCICTTEQTLETLRTPKSCESSFCWMFLKFSFSKLHQLPRLKNLALHFDVRYDRCYDPVVLFDTAVPSSPRLNSCARLVTLINGMFFTHYRTTESPSRNYDLSKFMVGTAHPSLACYLTKHPLHRSSRRYGTFIFPFPSCGRSTLPNAKRRSGSKL